MEVHHDFAEGSPIYEIKTCPSPKLISRLEMKLLSYWMKKSHGLRVPREPGRNI